MTPERPTTAELNDYFGTDKWTVTRSGRITQDARKRGLTHAVSIDHYRSACKAILAKRRAPTAEEELTAYLAARPRTIGQRLDAARRAFHDALEEARSEIDGGRLAWAVDDALAALEAMRPFEAAEEDDKE